MMEQIGDLVIAVIVLAGILLFFGVSKEAIGCLIVLIVGFIGVPLLLKGGSWWALLIVADLIAYVAVAWGLAVLIRKGAHKATKQAKLSKRGNGDNQGGYMTFFDLANIINSSSTSDMMFKIVEEESGHSLFSLRKEIEEANKCNGRYPRQLREKIAQVRRAIDGMDGYEQITRGTPTALGYKLNNHRGLNLPWEVKSRLKQSVWQYLLIDEEKDKDSIGVSLWKSFYEGMFWTAHRH